MEFNLQSGPVFLIRNETILLLSEALLPLSTMVSTNPAYLNLLPFFVSGKSFKRPIGWVVIIYNGPGHRDFVPDNLYKLLSRFKLIATICMNINFLMNQQTRKKSKENCHKTIL